MKASVAASRAACRARPAHAAHRGDGRAHAFQAEDEQRRRNQIGQLRQCPVDSGRHGLLFPSSLPRGHEHLQHALGHHVAAHGVAGGEITPMKPMTRSSVLSAAASATMAPTSTMPCTKFDPDMSGVCRMTGTRDMTS